MAESKVPRIPTLPESEWNEEQRVIMSEVDTLRPQGRAKNVFRTLVRHPRAYEGLFGWSRALVHSGELSPRHRELLTLRTAWNCQAPYSWAQHTHNARVAGVDEDSIQRVPYGPQAEGWVAVERALLTAADELHESDCISDETWAGLASELSEHELIEVPMIVGMYHVFGYTLRSLGVEVEDGLDPLPQLSKADPVS